MSNKLTHQFNEAAGHIALSRDEKDTMREKLIAYMELKPLHRDIPMRDVGRTSWFSFFHIHIHHFSGALLIAFLVTGSTFGMTFAADDALPGDLLYGVKVNLNEELRSAFISSREARIAWEQERAGRRLYEASLLVAEGRLDEKNQEKVSKLFAEHTNAVFQEVLAAEEEDPVFAAEATSMFEDSLDTHEAVLARLIVEEDEKSDERARELVEQVRTVAMEVERIREEVEEKIVDIDKTEQPTTDDTEWENEGTEVRESANMRIRAVERVRNRATELLAAAQEKVNGLEQDSEVRLQAQAQVDHGLGLMEEGATAISLYDYSTAYGAYRQASGIFQKIIQLLDVTKLFSLEIYSDDASTTPESVGNDEKNQGNNNEISLETVETVRKDALSVVENVRTLLLTQSGYEIPTIEKANTRIKDAFAYIMRGEIAMVLEDYEDAEVLFERAYDAALQAKHMLKKEGRTGSITDIPQNSSDTPAEQPEEEGLVLAHTYQDDIHTYSGAVDAPTPCHTVTGTAFVAESYPEQVTLILTTTIPDADTVCAQVVTPVQFSVEVTASEEAKLAKVMLDGVEVRWEITF